MITFRDWLKLKEDTFPTQPDPTAIQTGVANALNPQPQQVTKDPNIIANQLVQKIGKPVLSALAMNPIMKKYAAASQLNNKNSNNATNNPNTTNNNQVLQPNTMQNPITPSGSNFN